ncbi:hypothetical protein [Tianweitania sediminis]|uniref:Uncharacterized protein n=1 Tax=Tianweitania sediminis TaxID=1502156 RepID=A0A8J7QX75_9HYPH|nr:hypothetical protein [Tianweitania sediminis]MBP0438413.1 hypothetical protein [Tianweitania sediminis]
MSDQLNAVFVEHDPVTGEIIYCGSVPPDVIEGYPPLFPKLTFRWVGHGMDVPDPSAVYFDIDVNQIRPRPRLVVQTSKTVIAADGVDEAVISGIPAGVSFTVDDELFIADGEPIQMRSTLPASYRLAINHFPYLAFEMEIVAQ